MPLRTTKHRWGVVLDARDARELAHFYQRLLGWRMLTESDPWCVLAPDEDAGHSLSFMPEPGYQRPVWPPVAGEPEKSMHLDIEVDDLHEAVAHALACGAQLPDFQPQDHVRVLLDPAGHPFCVYVDDTPLS